MPKMYQQIFILKASTLADLCTFGIGQVDLWIFPNRYLLFFLDKSSSSSTYGRSSSLQSYVLSFLIKEKSGCGFCTEIFLQQIDISLPARRMAVDEGFSFSYRFRGDLSSNLPVISSFISILIYEAHGFYLYLSPWFQVVISSRHWIIMRYASSVVRL